VPLRRRSEEFRPGLQTYPAVSVLERTQCVHTHYTIRVLLISHSGSRDMNFTRVSSSYRITLPYPQALKVGASCRCWSIARCNRKRETRVETRLAMKLSVLSSRNKAISRCEVIAINRPPFATKQPRRYRRRYRRGDAVSAPGPLAADERAP